MVLMLCYDHYCHDRGQGRRPAASFRWVGPAKDKTSDQRAVIDLEPLMWTIEAGCGRRVLTLHVRAASPMQELLHSGSKMAIK